MKTCKKIFRRAMSILMCVLIILTLVPENSVPVKAMDYGDFTYVYYSSQGLVKITGYKGAGGDVVVPDIIDGKSVIAIGSSAFANCTNMTSIKLPNSISGIASYAFSGCTALKSVNIPDSVTYFGEYVFQNCAVLAEIKLPSDLKSLSEYTFSGCVGLTSVNIPKSLSNVSSSTFRDCVSLTQIDVALDNPNYSSQDGVLFNKNKTSLILYPKAKKGAFIIPNTITQIDSTMFSYCTGLISLNIPNSVNNIDDMAFSYCTALTEINVETANSNYLSEDGVLFNKEKTDLLKFPIGKTGNYTIPNGVVNICSMAFENCSEITNIIIPDSVTNISSGAIRNCSKITNIFIPRTVTNIEIPAISECNDLVNITVSDSNPAYSSQDGVLFNKTKTKLIFCPQGKMGTYCIPNNKITLESNAFTGCTKLTNVMIPDGVTQIPDYAFMQCSGITNITLPNSVIDIGKCAFKECSGLINVKLSSSITKISSEMFSGCKSLTQITIPRGATEICSFAFSRCTQLARVSIPNSVNNIAFGTFDSGVQVTIFGDSGSYAEEYAKKHNYTFNAGYIEFTPMPISTPTSIPTPVITIKPTIAPTPTKRPAQKSLSLKKLNPVKLSTKTTKISGVTTAKAVVKLVYGSKIIKKATASAKGTFTLNKLNLKKYKGKSLKLGITKSGYKQRTKSWGKIKK